MTAHSTPLSEKLAGVLLGLLGIALCGVLATYLTVRYLVWPRLDAWRPQIVAQIERQIGRPVAIGALRPSWEGLHPAIEIDGLRIDGTDGEPRLAVAAAYARVSWRSIAIARPRLASLRLDAPRLVVERLAPGRVAIAGFELDMDGPSDGHGLDVLLTQGEIAIAGASVRVLDRTGEIAPLAVDGVAIRLRNTGRRHQASVSASRVGDAADSLSVIAEVYRAPLARPSDWRRWHGDAHASGNGVELARLAALAQAFGAVLPAPAASAKGRLDALAWLKFDAGHVLDATLKAQARHAATTLPDGVLGFAEIGGEARLERQRDGGSVIKATGLSMRDAEGFALAADGDAELGFDAKRSLRTAWLRLQAFDAGTALDAVRRLPLPESARERLQGLGLAGRVRDLTLRWVGPDAPPRAETRPADRSVDAEMARPASAHFEVGASFDGLGVQFGELPDGKRLPGFGNLTGSLRATDRGGLLTLASRQATIALPRWFDEPTIPFERLDGEFDWTVDADTGAVRVSSQNVTFANADLRGSVAGHWRSGGKGPGLVDIVGRAERLDARRVTRYLPLGIPTPTREWIDHALLAGSVEDIRIEMRGDIWDFPYRDPAEGRFRLAAAVRDGTLAYSPMWPRIEQLRGDVAFEGVGFEARASQASLQGVRVTDTVARLADYRESVLQIEGRGAGAAQDMLAFVNASPLASTVSSFTRELRVGGDAKAVAKLVLPIFDLAASRVAGSVELAGNDVVLDGTIPPFEGVAGRLEFSERGIALPDVRATFLGGPIRVDGKPAGEGRMRIDAAGSIDAAGMRRLVDNTLTRRLDGRTDYRASVEVDRRASTLRIESDLVGLSSTLPAPFAKRAAEPWPLRVATRPITPPAASARPPGDRLDVRLRNDLALVVERERDPRTERLVAQRASFALDGEPVLLDRGLSVLLRTRSIDVDAWRALLDDGELERLDRDARAGLGAGSGLSMVPDLVSVVADDLTVAGRPLHEVVVGASRSDGRWRANIASREVEGHFEWRDARVGERIGTLSARFARLVLPASREGEVESALSASPNQLPALDIVADELVLGDVSMGRLELSATNGGTALLPVWRLDRLVVTSPAARLQAKGSWSFVGAPRPRTGAPTASLGNGPAGAAPTADASAKAATAEASADARSTALDFELEVRDAGDLLAALGLKDTMNGGTGSLGGRAQWRGSPLRIDYGSLDGLVQVAMGKGEFLKVEPGIAKLIGVLNMQSLPKRLSGDFRDLFGEGFAFDSAVGQVRIERGIARTDDLRIRGLQAQVHIRGEADLKQETQRLNVEVVPELNAGLASIAFGAMVNPVIGLGSFAAQYVLRKPLQQALAYDVDVTGTWSDPMVSERNRRPVQPAPSSP